MNKALCALNSPFFKGGAPKGVGDLWRLIYSNMLKYNPKLKKYAGELRNNSTLSEILLWKRLRNKQLKGYKFLRQKPLNSYIVDFYCHKLKLIIEIDGSSHYENQKYDESRDRYFEKSGFFMLRIGDSRVKSNIKGVVFEIKEVIEKLESAG